MRIGLILPTNLYFAPYCKIYTNILDEINIEYDLITWDRESIGDKEGIVYKRKSPKSASKFVKLFDYYLYSRFVTKILKRKKYDKIIVFGPQIGLFIYSFLKKHYLKNFLFDYRDLSIEQSLPNKFNKLLSISSVICISSPGFKKCLPPGYNYILSHNLDIKNLRESLKLNQTPINDTKRVKSIEISTIGGIRDFEQNQEIINSFKNEPNFILKFIGKGIAEDDLKEYCKTNDIHNVEFSGFYKKNEEADFYKNADFINIYYPKILSHETAISNRFYNALIYKKPMIVTNSSIQGDFIEKFDLGLSISNCENLKKQIEEYTNNFDEFLFARNCNLLLLEFENDYNYFKFELIKYLNS